MVWNHTPSSFFLSLLFCVHPLSFLSFNSRFARLTSNWKSSCLRLSGAGIILLCHHSQTCGFFICAWGFVLFFFFFTCLYHFLCTTFHAYCPQSLRTEGTLYILELEIWLNLGPLRTISSHPFLPCTLWFIVCFYLPVTASGEWFYFRFISYFHYGLGCCFVNWTCFSFPFFRSHTC